MWKLVAIVCLSFGGLLQAFAYAQDSAPAPASGGSKIDLSRGELVPLVVRDFEASEQTQQALYSADLLRAVPDALYLYLLGNPRLGVSRGPTLPHTTSAATPSSQAAPSSAANAPTNQVPRTPGSAYSLEGQIRAVPMNSGSTPGAGTDRGVQLLSVRYQLFGSGLKPVVEGSFVVGSGELPDHLAEIARLVGEKISPAEASVQVYLPTVETSCFSSEEENRFYEETLSGLLRTSMSGTDFIKPVNTPTGVYVVREVATAAPHGCLMSASLTSASGETLAADSEHGTASDVLEIQSRLNQKMIDALHIESSSAGNKAGFPNSASAKEYMLAADRYRQTDPDLAAALYRKALSLDSKNKDLTKRLAQSLLDANRPQDVVELISQPADVSQYQLLASAYLKLGDNAKVMQELEAGLRLNSPDRDYYQQASAILEQIGEFEAAANALRAGAAHAKPGDGLAAMADETLRRGAKTLILAGKSKEALPLALESLKTDPNSEWGQRLAGIALIDTDDPDSGEKHLLAAMHIDPNEFSEVELSKLRNTQKRYAEARAYAQQAIEAAPGFPGGFSALEASVQNEHDAREVTAWLDKYVTMVPPNKLALLPWSFIQTKYLPLDATAIHRQYAAYKAATKDVPYADWEAGWTDLVELSMLDNHTEEASSLAHALLKGNLNEEDQVTMGFYAWLTDLLLNDCKHYETDLSASLVFLGSSDMPEKITWDFTATRNFIKDRAAHGQLGGNALSLIMSWLTLLETPTTPAKAQQFNDLASQFSKTACVSH